MKLTFIFSFSFVIIVALFFLQACSGGSKTQGSKIYIDSSNRFAKHGKISFDMAERVKNDSFKYDSLKWDAFGCFVYADSFLILSLKSQFNETRKKYQNTDSFDIKLLYITNQILDATAKEKEDKNQYAFFLRRVKSYFSK